MNDETMPSQNLPDGIRLPHIERAGTMNCDYPASPSAQNPLCWISPIMVKGQRVICVNDAFADFIRAIYTELPVEGGTYTIREVFLGREKVVNAGDTATVGLLLVELHNPTDPFHAAHQELGFSSERFAPPAELPPDAVEEEVASPANTPDRAHFN